MKELWYVVCATNSYGRLFAVSKHDTEDRARQEALKKLATIGHSYRIEIAKMPDNIFIWRNGHDIS